MSGPLLLRLEAELGDLEMERYDSANILDILVHLLERIRRTIFRPNVAWPSNSITMTFPLLRGVKLAMLHNRKCYTHDKHDY